MGTSGGSSSNDAQFRVSLPVMGEVFDDLVSFRGYLAEQVETAQHVVMALGSGWSGQSREAQLAFFAELRRGMDKIDEGLAEFSESVSTSKGHYETAISTNKAMWDGRG